MYADQKFLKKLNSRLISNQYLKKVATGTTSLTEITDSLCGVNSQNFRDSYMSFWIRSSSFSENKLVSSIKPKGSLSRTWTVRGTVHTFPSSDYSIHVFGSPVERYLKAYDRYARQLGVPDREGRINALYLPLLDEIGKNKVNTDLVNGFISQRLEELGIKGKRHLHRGWTSEKTIGPTWEGFVEMSYLGILSNAGREGSGNLWMNTRYWLGHEIEELDFEDSARNLVISYIDNYGPVTLKDISYWTGHRVDFLKHIITDIGDEINEGKLNGLSENYYFIDEIDSDGNRPPHTVILPRFDSLIMGYMDKSRIMTPEYKDRVSVKAGVINPTILLDGFVQGIWRKEKRGKLLKITIEPFRKFSDRERKALERKFTRYAEHEEMQIQIKYLENA